MSTPTIATSTTGQPGDAARLDRLEASLAEILDVVRSEQAERERWRELAREVTPVIQGAMTVASGELQDLSADVTIDDAVRLARTAARAMPRLESLLAQLGSLSELTYEVTALTGAGMASLSDTLATAERRGYFAAARYSADAVDRFVTTLQDGADAPPPSTLALLRRLRDPQVRQGLARALDLLDALGGAPSPDHRPTGRPTGADDPAKD